VVLKLKKDRKKGEIMTKKLNFILFMRFYLEGRNVINKKGLFYAKFFEFEDFFWPSFFWVASSLSIL
jgi:hypothetical protein